jgi:uncharacterized membrane protein YoaK (UPF0700 family)
MRKALQKAYQSEAKVEWFKEIVSHCTFYATAVAGILVQQQGSLALVIVAVAWVVVCLNFSFRLACQLDEMEKAKEELDKARFRKTADMIRSAVKEELSRATLRMKDTVG